LTSKATREIKQSKSASSTFGNRYHKNSNKQSNQTTHQNITVTMGSAFSSNKKREEVVDLASTSSSDVGSHEVAEKKSVWVDMTSDSDTEFDEDDDDQDIDDRLEILKEARKLRMLADFFLHPEKPVSTDATATARCYFNRPSAPVQESKQEMEESVLIMKECRALKKLAVDFQHPELPVETDATAGARCYYDRASAPQQESLEEAYERYAILEEMRMLRQAAFDYLHPEVPVVTKDPTVFGRNYFFRPSAPEQEPEEAQAILDDVEKLRQLAKDFRHPELPVRVSPTAFGRNYFTRPSALPQESLEEQTERMLIEKDMRAMKQLAVNFLHPEIPLTTTDPTVFGRNYFNRSSAPINEDEEERQLVLADAKALRKLATDFLHPELPLVTDPNVFGRNYFNRPSAIPQCTWEEEQEMERIFQECRRLEQLAVEYHHLEIHVDNGNVYHHHAHFDMDDDLHLHHVRFDRNTDHHDIITETRTATSGTEDPEAAVDFKLSQSPGCVMTFTDPSDVTSLLAPNLTSSTM